MRTTKERGPNSQNMLIRKGLWVVGVILASGIGIAGFSIAAGLLVAA